MTGIGVTQRRVIRSEWIKLRSLRSTVITLAAATVSLLALSVLASLIAVHDWASMSAAERAEMQVSSRVFAGRLLAELGIGVVGVVVVCGEYGSGMIRATLAAVPARLPVLWAKLAVLTAVGMAVMTAAAFASFWVGDAILDAHWDFGLGDPGVLRAVAMAGVVLTSVCLLGAALGFILRNAAAAIAALFGILLVLPFVGQFSRELARYLPSSAMTSLVTPRTEAYMPATSLSFVLLLAYTGLAIAGAAYVLTRRDA